MTDRTLMGPGTVDTAIESTVSPKTAGGCAPTVLLGYKSMNDYELDTESLGEQPWRDPDVLETLCVDRELTVHEAGEVLGCAGSTVHRWLHRHDVEFRDGRPDALDDGDQLRDLYIGEGLTTVEIGDRLGCTTSAVNYWLKQHGVPLREGSTHRWYPELDDRDFLHEAYVANERSLSEIADEIGCNHVTVWNALRSHGIDTRDQRPPDPRFGEDHPNWKGGYPENRGTNWPALRQRALETADRQCQGCGITEADHQETHGVGLSVHHIRPVTSFDEPADADTVDNLVALCRDCHPKWEGVPLRPQLTD